MDELIIQETLESLGPANGIGSSLLSDLRCKHGADDNIEWFMLYEKHPISPTIPPRLLYIKVNILTPLGRRLVALNQGEIARKCNVYSSDTGRFQRALSFAMAIWDNNQP